MRFPRAARNEVTRGAGSTEESRVASSRIRVRFPGTAPVECRRDSIALSKVVERRTPGIESPSTKWSLRPLSTSSRAANAVRTTRTVSAARRTACLHTPSSPPFCGEEQRQLAWLITKRPSVRIRPPLPLRSTADAGPHKPARDGSSPSAATMLRSGPAATTRAFEALKRGFESLLRNHDRSHSSIWGSVAGGCSPEPTRS